MPAELDDLVADLAPTGVLRASINLGNPILAQGSSDVPSGITVDIAREVARRLGVELELLTFDAARKSFAAMAQGEADLCFLAIDPTRAAEVAFTAAYVTIEGVFVVAQESSVRTADDVDVAGTRIGVKEGSAYDLHLTRTIERAEIVRGAEGVDVYVDEDLEVVRGFVSRSRSSWPARPGNGSSSPRSWRSSRPWGCRSPVALNPSPGSRRPSRTCGRVGSSSRP